MNAIGSGLDWAGIDGSLLLIDLVFAAIVVILARFVSQWLRWRIEGSLYNKSFGRNGAVLLGRLTSNAVYVLAALIILTRFGVSSTGILTFLGAFSVALGLSLQDVFRNFFTGILLLMERPFRVGDYIAVRNVEGEVQGIDVRTTLLRQADGTMTLVPNSIVFAEIVTNRARAGFRRVDLEIIGTDISVADLEAGIHASLEDIEAIRRPIPAPLVRKIGAEERTLELSIVVDETDGATSAVMSALVTGPLAGKIEVRRV